MISRGLKPAYHFHIASNRLHYFSCQNKLLQFLVFELLFDFVLFRNLGISASDGETNVPVEETHYYIHNAEMHIKLCPPL